MWVVNVLLTGTAATNVSRPITPGGCGRTSAHTSNVAGPTSTRLVVGRGSTTTVPATTACTTKGRVGEATGVLISLWRPTIALGFLRSSSTATEPTVLRGIPSSSTWTAFEAAATAPESIVRTLTTTATAACRRELASSTSDRRPPTTRTRVLRMTLAEWKPVRDCAAPAWVLASCHIATAVAAIPVHRNASSAAVVRLYLGACGLPSGTHDQRQHFARLNRDGSVGEATTATAGVSVEAVSDATTAPSAP